MKLENMIRKPSFQKLNKITETRFGVSIDYDAITLPKAMTMRNKIMETVNAIRKTSAIHTAEKNPKYLEMLIIYEGLSRWIDAYKHQRKLMEGEVGQAQAILAAKDMVDTVQDLIEKVGKMQNEQLPALIDSIRDQIGAVQADTFKNSVGQSLTTMASTLGQAREQLDTAARSLAGEETSGGGDAMGMPGGDIGGDPMGGAPLPGAASGDFDVPPDEGTGGDGFGAVDAAAGGPEELGRERR
jgi:hypothetical protein